MRKPLQLRNAPWPLIVAWGVLLLLSVGGVVLLVLHDGPGALRSLQGLGRLAWMMGVAVGGYALLWWISQRRRPFGSRRLD